MSKIGSKPIQVPQGVTIKVENDIIYIKGPKGKLELKTKYIRIIIEHSVIKIDTSCKKEKKYKKYHGLYRSLINNMVTGIVQGFKKEITLEGVGYRVNIEKNLLAFSIGFSNIIYKKIPQNLNVQIFNQNKQITISGIDKQVVGAYAAEIRQLRPPECYLGKGIRYSDEKINKKQGKNTSK